MSQFGTITINGKTYDLDDIEMDDVEAVEDLCLRKRKIDGEWIEEPTPFGEINFSRGRAMKALSWVILRREAPEMTFEEVGKLKLVAFSAADEEVPDTGPPAEEESNGSAPEGSGALHSVESLSTPG
jgi:hypothetical protein